MLLKWQKWMLLSLIMIFMISAGCSNAESESRSAANGHAETVNAQLNELNQHAERMYNYMNQGDVVEARSELLRISDGIQAVAFHDLLTNAGYEAVQTTIFEAKKTFNQVRFDMDQGLVEAARVRLLFDALTHEHQPMWHQYYKILRNDTEELQSVINDKQLNGAKHALDKLQYHYSVIRPAVLVQRDEADVIKIDSLFTFMDRAADEQNLNHMAKGTVEFIHIWNALFDKEDSPTYAPIADHKQPFYWIFGIGSSIVTVLAFVGWKKFKHRKGYVPVKRPESDDTYESIS